MTDQRAVESENPPMRCRGLTDDRRRCTNQAVDGTGYCEQHMGDCGEITESPNDGSAPGRGLRGLIDRLRGAPPGHVVPDSAKSSLPAWIKSSSTLVLMDQLLHHPDTMTRWNIAFALRKRRDPLAIESLWEALRRDPVSMVRQQCAVALGKIGTTSALGPLIEGLVHDSDAGVRQACAIALGNLGCTVAATDLGGVLQRDQAAFVRWDCALALGQVGNLTVESLLTELAQKDQAEVVRRACQEALAEIRQRT